jgi:retron-type reverse transcriptase
MKIYKNVFAKIINPGNLFLAWAEFKSGKLRKPDVLEFEYRLEENIFQLYRDLKYHTYKHGVYRTFYITDPKLREIHKATVRDRVLHHAIYRVVYPIFQPVFISSSFSCQIDKGNHKGVDYLAKIIRKESKNYTRLCFVLKCDIKKFFDSVNHQILTKIIKRKISDVDTLTLLQEIIGSFGTKTEHENVQMELFDFRGENRERERERERAAPPTGGRLLLK